MLGHLVSNYVKKVLPKHIETELKKEKVDEQTPMEVIQAALRKAYLTTNAKLINGKIDCYFSGTTVCGLL